MCTYYVLYPMLYDINAAPKPETRSMKRFLPIDSRRRPAGRRRQQLVLPSPTEPVGRPVRRTLRMMTTGLGWRFARGFAERPAGGCGPRFPPPSWAD